MRCCLFIAEFHSVQINSKSTKCFDTCQHLLIFPVCIGKELGELLNRFAFLHWTNCRCSPHSVSARSVKIAVLLGCCRLRQDVFQLRQFWVRDFSFPIIALIIEIIRFSSKIHILAVVGYLLTRIPFLRHSKMHQWCLWFFWEVAIPTPLSVCLNKPNNKNFKQKIYHGSPFFVSWTVHLGTAGVSRPGELGGADQIKKWPVTQFSCVSSRFLTRPRWLVGLWRFCIVGCTSRPAPSVQWHAAYLHYSALLSWQQPSVE